ncbi:general stress protein [Actinoplanes sp. DH11]|uniref:general stress protein n=1 Tax=Actinoplanes sp. DH11 TaxID=2857011 RepID=UPI001E570560|nr:general stress protein [Actinoplanes sp. DH11]
MTTPSNDSPTTPVPNAVPATAAGPGPAAPTAPGAVPPGPAGVPALPAQTGGAGPAGPTVVVGTYPQYAQAQQAVDHLSDNKFPVERTSIIGTDLRLVENVLGRLTVGRAAAAGAASGAWFGLFIGLLFGIFSDTGWVGVILTTVLVGAVWGAIFGAIAHAATGGRRDFTSRSSLQAAQYAVLADAEVADEARALLVRLNWQASGAQ